MDLGGLYLFPDGQYMRLRSREHGTYLYADENGLSVSLSPLPASMKVAWVVHRIDGDNNHVLLQSAAYGRYLACTDVSAPRGCSGFSVAQRNYDELHQEDIRWRAYRIEVGGQDVILLLHHVVDRDRDFYGYLRVNVRHLPWDDNDVSVDSYTNIKMDNAVMFAWVEEPIPSRERIPRLPRPSRYYLGNLHLLSSREVIANGNANNVSFRFTGWSLFHLREELIRRLGISPDVSDNLVMYVRPGTHGRLTPLVVSLPHLCTQTLVITVETPANRGPRYPDFEEVPVALQIMVGHDSRIFDSDSGRPEQVS